MTNAGHTEATNISADRIESYGVTADIELIQRLAVGAHANLSFRTRRGDQYFGRSLHPTTLIDAVRRGAEGTTNDFLEYTEMIASHVIPVRFTYADPRGVAFETHAEIRWNHITHQGYAHHAGSGPVVEAAWWRCRLDQLLLKAARAWRRR